MHTVDAHDASKIIDFLTSMSLAIGISGLSVLLVFDLFLGRLGVTAPHILKDVVQALAFIIILMAVLRGQGVELLSLLTGSAVLTAVIGLALQSTIANLFAGLTLQFDQTISVGDWVQVGTRVGRITRIKWRSTFLITRDGDNVILPNGELVRNEVLNFSKPTGTHRASVKVGMHYRHAPNDVKSMLIEATRGVPGVLPTPPPDAFPSDFGDSGGGVHGAILDHRHRARSRHRWRGTLAHLVRGQARRVRDPVPYAHRVHARDHTGIGGPGLRGGVPGACGRHRQGRHLHAARRGCACDAGARDEDGALRDRRAHHHAGRSGDSLYLISSGQVGVRLEVEGAEREVATLKDGEFFGEMSLMTGEPRRATCAAKTDVTCYVIEYRAFHHVLSERPKIAEDISAILATRQMALAGEREGLSAEARARRAAENSSRLLARIRDFFHLR